LENEYFGFDKREAIAIPKYAEAQRAHKAHGLSNIQKHRVGY